MDQMQSMWYDIESLFARQVWMFWWAEELFSEAAVCYIELWRDVESSTEMKGPVKEWIYEYILGLSFHWSTCTLALVTGLCPP